MPLYSPRSAIPPKNRTKKPALKNMIKPFSEPFALFQDWMAEAERSEPNDANAMALSTAGADGYPTVRMVLLKHVDERGFVFYTNYESRKGLQLIANPRAALLFHWKSLKRQINIEGAIAPVEDSEADAYFASRDRSSRIGAWASKQSRPLAGRFELEKRIAEYVTKYPVGAVPRPPYWSGFRLTPERIEFWSDKPFRLHERNVYYREEDGWRNQMLFP